MENKFLKKLLEKKQNNLNTNHFVPIFHKSNLQWTFMTTKDQMLIRFMFILSNLLISKILFKWLIPIFAYRYFVENLVNNNE